MADAIARTPPSAWFTEGRAIAVLRAPDARDYRRVVDVLVAAGIRSIELTLSTPGTLQVLPPLVRDLGDDAEVGVGTVVSTEQAEQALEGGAAFLVTPTVRPDIIATALRARRPIYPGALTPSEVAINWDAGATAVKIFPASTVGPSYLPALRGPMPTLAAVPSGGVAIDDVPKWFDAGAVAVRLGGELLGDALRGGDLEELAARARSVRALIDGARRGER